MTSIVMPLQNKRSKDSVLDDREILDEEKLEGKTPYLGSKSAAEGLMDISLLTANANQLKVLIYYNQSSKTFYAALSLIIVSLILQIVVGIMLIFKVSFIKVQSLMSEAKLSKLSNLIHDLFVTFRKILNISSAASKQKAKMLAKSRNIWCCLFFLWQLSTCWRSYWQRLNEKQDSEATNLNGNLEFTISNTFYYAVFILPVATHFEKNLK